jgi:hypothetical protein
MEKAGWFLKKLELLASVLFEIVVLALLVRMGHPVPPQWAKPLRNGPSGTI